MTKDRFSSFKKRRQGGSSFSGIRRPSSSGKNGGTALFKNKAVVVQVDPLGNDNPILQMYHTQVEEAQNLLEEMKVDISLVKQQHSTIISSPFHEDDAKEELDKLTLRITTRSNLFRIKLGEIKNSIAKVAEKDHIEDEERSRSRSRNLLEEGSLISAPTGISAHVRIGEIQYSALLKSFMEMMGDYHCEKISHQDRCKVRLRRQLSITGISLTEAEVEKMIEEGNFSVFQHDILCQTEEARETLVLLEVRHTELKKLEKDLEMLFSLMQEMAILLADQGEVIDRIDKHVASAKEDVSDGKDKLKVAVVYRRSSLQKKIYVAGIVIAIILVLILVIYFTYGNSSTGAAWNPSRSS